MRWANGWIAEVDEDDPDKIKDNLMDLCDHKKAELVVRHSIDKMQRHSRKKLIALLEKNLLLCFTFQYRTNFHQYHCIFIA